MKRRVQKAVELQERAIEAMEQAFMLMGGDGVVDPPGFVNLMNEAVTCMMRSNNALRPWWRRFNRASRER